MPSRRRSEWETWWFPLLLLAAFLLRLPLALLAPSPGIADPTYYFPADRPALDPVQYREEDDPRASARLARPAQRHDAVPFQTRTQLLAAHLLTPKRRAPGAELEW